MKFRPFAFLLFSVVGLGGPSSLDAAVAGPPTVVSIDPPPGVVSRLDQITVTFNEPVTDLDHNDLRIHDYYAASVSGSNEVVVFKLWQPAYGVVKMVLQDILDLDATQNTMATKYFQYTFVDTDAPVVTNVFPIPSTTVRSLGEVEVSFSEPVQGVDATGLLMNGVPATNVILKAGGVCIFQFETPNPGAVQISWAANPSITDHAASPNTFAGAPAWNYTRDPALVYADVVITEFTTGNRTGLADEDGLAADWIEIHNRGDHAVDLAGWSLSDDALEPGKWVFPTCLLEAGERLVVFASGKDIRAPAGTNRFHLNFTLSAGGEFLGLFTPESPRQLASGFDPEFPEQRNDYSYGLDASNHWRYFATPTPGLPNPASSITSFAQPVHFSVERGFFTQPFDLVLTSETPGAAIRYTTDGSEPGANRGLVYRTPLRVAATMILRATAFRPDLAPSVMRTHTYLFNPSAANRSLPALSIVTTPNNLTGPNGIIGLNGGTYVNGIWYARNPADYNNLLNFGIAWERPVSAEFIQPTDNSGFQADCGIRVNASEYSRFRARTTDKFSYRLYFRRDYGPAQLEYPLLPTTTRTRFDQLVLRGGHNDASNPFIKDELNRRLFADMGQGSAQGTFVNLFINGVFKGYFNPCERVDEEALQDWEGEANEFDRITVSSQVQGGDDAAWRELMNPFISNQDIANPAVYEGIASRLDLVNFADYLILEVYGANWDWPHNNWRAARPRTPGGRFQFYAWDLEAAFDTGSRQPTFNVFTNTYRGLVNGAEIGVIFNGLTNSPEFRLLFADRVQKHFFNYGALSDANITNRFYDMKGVLAGVIASMNLGIPTNWVPNRRAPLFSQFSTYGLYVSNAPAFNQHGGLVPAGFSLTLAAALGGTIYFTTNGTDPREAFTGAITASALPYTAAWPLNQDMLVRARTRKGSDWSPLVEAQFQVARLGWPIRITEINYNPPGGNAYEFVELHNFGSTPINLSGWAFDEGISFLFPNDSTLAPDARIILANNADPAAFAARYPGVSVFGWFGGNLVNSGERLALKDADGDPVTSVNYDDENGWPVAADGLGSSLELLNATSDPNSPASWRASVASNGTPGLPPQSSPTPVTVTISEVMANNGGVVDHEGTFPDWIELHNPLPQPQDLAGCSLTDDGNARKFVLPPDTVIESNGFLVVWCDRLTNTTSGLHSGFGLQKEGGNLFFYDAQTNRVTALSYGPQLTNYTLADDVASFVLGTPTPGAPNAFAATASPTNLVLNEWLANPPAGGVDWVELRNRSASAPVALQGLYLGTSNAIARLASPLFIPPGGHLVLVADEGSGPAHLDFKLPAAGGALVLYDASARELDRVTYPAQAEGVSRGRWPDGGAIFTNFVGTASPGASNYVNTYSGPVLNEILARTLGLTNADFIELFNPAASAFDLGGMSLSVDTIQPGQWIFPPGTVMPSNSYLVVWCDADRPISTNRDSFNAGRAIDAASGAVYLFNAAGQTVSQIEFGPQVRNKSIGLSGGQWRLLATPTPGTGNAATQTLAAATGLRINEWMAQPADGPDWFELYNATNQPIELGGLYVSDDPSTTGLTKFRLPPLSFIEASNHVRLVADSTPSQGRNHVNFSLDERGEALVLVRTNLTTVTVLDLVPFGAQPPGISQGRLADGGTNLLSFPGSASPGEANYLRLPNVVISEIYLYAPSAPQNAIELHNSSTAPVSVGGWFLSGNPANFRQYRVPDGAVIQPGDYLVILESEFGAGATGFHLDAAIGGEVWFSAALANGSLTGYRTGAKYGPAASGTSIGRITTSQGVEYVALSSVTLGASNAAPRIGPVVVNEIMYHPPGGTTSADQVEYLELLNLSASETLLHDPLQVTNTWRLRGGIQFDFPPGATLTAGGYALVVDFDPTDSTALAGLRDHYGIPLDVPVFGPFQGRLANEGDTLQWLRPEAPVGSHVPYLLVEQIAYRDSAPWPSAADGTGVSLQRRDSTSFANNPLNWQAAAPTPGLANAPTPLGLPVITAAPADASTPEKVAVALAVTTAGNPPLRYQWRFNGIEIPGATNAAFWQDYVLIDNEGDYDVFVSNPSGSTLSSPARLIVMAPPEILAPPTNVFLRPNGVMTLTVSARGTQPILYQWRKNGVDLPGETNATYRRTGLQLTDEGTYEVMLSNRDGTAAAAASLVMLINPTFVVSPVSQTVAPGEMVTLSAMISGNPAPFGFELRAGSATVASNSSWEPYTFFSFAAPSVPTSQPYRIIARNLALPGGSGSLYATLTVAPDPDGDGLPTPWETASGLNPDDPSDREADTDGDGISNWNEYLAGTNPTNAGSYLRVEALTFGQTNLLSFFAESNKTYSVLWKESLATGNWTKLADVVARAHSRIEVIPDPLPAAPQRLYRLITPRAPDPASGDPVPEP